MKNQIGLEAEYFLLDDANGELKHPSSIGLECDDFFLLGEMRAKPAETRQQVIGNFMEKYYEVEYKAKKHKCHIDITTGFRHIEPKLYSEVLRQMQKKCVSTSKNIYPDVDILSLTDAVSENGRISSYKVSTGLHVHFSSQEIVENKSLRATYIATPIPLSVEGVSAKLDLYRKEKDEEVVVRAVANLITRPVLMHIISQLDKEILPQFHIEETLKFRNPGFYELKDWGFEYRSLPFNRSVLGNLAQIVDFSFNLLEELPL